jgi:hypothetical protein
MKRTARHTLGKNAQGQISIPGLLMSKGFNATLTFFCTLCIFSLD